MRLLLLALGLLPQAGWAHLLGGEFVDGSYVLSDSRFTRMTGQLKLQGGSSLVLKEDAGKKHTFTPYEIVSFRIGSQQYVTAGGFHVIGSLGGAEIDRAFVQQLDSGQLVLMRYDYNVSTPIAVNASGGMSGGGGELSTFLLSGGAIPGITAAQVSPYSSGGKNFREAIRPYFAGRPDLQRMLDTKRITAKNLVAAVRAFNINSPFTPSAALNLD